MKTIKITPWVHTELKVYAARNKENITHFADAALLHMLSIKGHKVKAPKPKKP